MNPHEMNPRVNCVKYGSVYLHAPELLMDHGYMGCSINGGPPKMEVVFLENPSINGWELGAPPWLRKPPYMQAQMSGIPWGWCEKRMIIIPGIPGRECYHISRCWNHSKVSCIKCIEMGYYFKILNWIAEYAALKFAKCKVTCHIWTLQFSILTFKSQYFNMFIYTVYIYIYITYV